MMRTCGDCQACCKALPLTTIGKPAGTRCQHQRFRKGCAVFAAFGRPHSCAVWNCLWLLDPSHPLGRPDRVGYFVDPTPDFVTLGEDAKAGRRIRAIQVWVDASDPDAHRHPPLREWLEGIASDIVAVARIGVDRVITLIPPRFSETGMWLEIESRPMKPSTVGEIRKALIEERLARAAAGGALEEPGASGRQDVSRETEEPEHGVQATDQPV